MRLWLRFYPQDSAFGSFPPFFKRKLLGTSLAVQWLRLCLPRQGVWVQSLVGELRYNYTIHSTAKTTF